MAEQTEAEAVPILKSIADATATLIEEECPYFGGDVRVILVVVGDADSGAMGSGWRPEPGFPVVRQMAAELLSASVDALKKAGLPSMAEAITSLVTQEPRGLRQPTRVSPRRSPQQGRRRKR